MAFDAGMVAALANELDIRLKGARIDKIQQPEKEEIVFTLRAERENVRLSISSGANNPRVNLTSITKENPVSAPMFCMLLRKYLLGGRILGISQYDFERLIEISIECRDEMGFLCTRYIVVEIMGKYSNIIFCDENKKIINAIKPVDFTTSSKRQVLSGMTYEYPPKQEKISPLKTNKEEFISLYKKTSPEKNISRFIVENYLGISLLVAGEIAYRTVGDADARMCDCSAESLWINFNEIIETIKKKNFTPCILKNGDKPFEFSFITIKQYGSVYSRETCDSFSELVDEYYVKKERINHIKQISADIHKFLTNNENRIVKKITIHKDEIRKANDNLKYKNIGDIITANIYMLKRGDTKVKLFDYSEDIPVEKVIELDSKLSPSQNAQRYYKRYNKAKKAASVLATQLKSDESELEYIRSVIDSLSRTESENDLEEIRRELKSAGYGIKSKSNQKNNLKTTPMEFKTENGYTVLCGKNNIQNDALTFKTASKLDYWFHAKNVAGSHCILICNGEEPPEIDFTQAAIIAATHSKASDGENVAVDYTFAKNVKKINSSKLGMVTYSTNWTAYVTPDEKLCEKLRVR
ncbi:MAG: fibronectin/fibrinogen-binding protein [Ruminococcaceae bacterium]|nr:fibronectin/fibrinogen-binding protein [Oscillospiraceae bacterium]